MTTVSSGGSSTAARSLPRQAKTTSAPDASACSFETKARQRPVQPDVERRGRFALERVGAEGHDLELRMAERAVERLLPGVPGCSEDRQRRHAGCILV